jgi:hypothetical protein
MKVTAILFLCGAMSCTSDAWRCRIKEKIDFYQKQLLQESEG